MVGLAGYKILHSIGSGGMGSVYAAERQEDGSRVAVKFVSSPDITVAEHLKARMAREAQAVARLASPHLVRVFEVGQDPETGIAYLVMELLRGEDVQHLLDRSAPLAPPAALAIVAQACAGLQVAHDANVVHRDVKPANLHLTRLDDGETLVKVLDFGVAKVKMDEALGAGAHALTRTGSILGSPLYMSPEQARGAKGIDHRADIWSLGVVLYHALAGRTPFHDVEALGELIMTICQKPAPLVQDFAPWVTPNVAAIVHRALRIEPGERFASAAEMGAEIAKLLPQGTRLRDADLVGVAPGERGLAATRLIVTGPTSSLPPATGPGSLSASAASLSSAGRPGAASAPSLPPSLPPSGATHGRSLADHPSTAGLANSRETEVSRSRGWGLRGAVAAVAAVAIVAAVVRFTGGPGASPTGTAAQPEPVAATHAAAPPPVVTPSVPETPPTAPASAASQAVAPSATPVASSKVGVGVGVGPKVASKPPASAPSGQPKVPPPPDSASFGGRE